MRPTTEQIDSEIQALKGLRDNVRPRGVRDNVRPRGVELINAQLDVLVGLMSVDEVYDVFGDESADEFNQEELEVALSAALWLNGCNSGEGPAAGRGEAQ